MTARQSRFRFAPSADHPRVADVSGSDPTTPLLQDLLSATYWHRLANLADCLARQVGYGNELASITYGDEPDDDEEPFEGVRITGDYRDESAMLSRRELDAIFADLFEMLVVSAPKPNEPWWPAFVENARRVAARTGRPLP